MCVSGWQRTGEPSTTHRATLSWLFFSPFFSSFPPSPSSYVSFFQSQPCANSSGAAGPRRGDQSGRDANPRRRRCAERVPAQSAQLPHQPGALRRCAYLSALPAAAHNAPVPHRSSPHIPRRACRDQRHPRRRQPRRGHQGNFGPHVRLPQLHAARRRGCSRACRKCRRQQQHDGCV